MFMNVCAIIIVITPQCCTALCHRRKSWWAMLALHDDPTHLHTCSDHYLHPSQPCCSAQEF